MKQKYYIILNPCAGSGKTMSEWQKAVPELKRLGVSYDSIQTTGPRTAVSIAARAASEGWRNFVAVGGDGTVHEVFSGIMNFIDSRENQESSSVAMTSDFTLSVIPIGSGNDWIRSTGVPQDVIEAVRCIAKGSFIKQDVVRVSSNGSIMGYMANIGGVGYDANVCVRVNKQKEQGLRSPLLYVKGLFYVLKHYESCPMKVECDGREVFNGDCFTIAISNGKYSGGGFRQTSEQTSLDDGLLDMSVIPALSVFQFLTRVGRVFTGTLYKTKPVQAYRASKIVITPTTDRKEYFEVDGEVLGQIPVTIEVLPEKISVLTGERH